VLSPSTVPFFFSWSPTEPVFVFFSYTPLFPVTPLPINPFLGKDACFFRAPSSPAPVCRRSFGPPSFVHLVCSFTYPGSPPCDTPSRVLVVVRHRRSLFFGTSGFATAFLSSLPVGFFFLRLAFFFLWAFLDTPRDWGFATRGPAALDLWLTGPPDLLKLRDCY